MNMMISCKQFTKAVTCSRTSRVSVNWLVETITMVLVIPNYHRNRLTSITSSSWNFFGSMWVIIYKSRFLVISYHVGARRVGRDLGIFWNCKYECFPLRLNLSASQLLYQGQIRRSWCNTNTNIFQKWNMKIWILGKLFWTVVGCRFLLGTAFKNFNQKAQIKVFQYKLGYIIIKGSP